MLFVILPPHPLLRPSSRVSGRGVGPHVGVRGKLLVPVPLNPTPYSSGSSAFGFWQVPHHLEQVPGTLPRTGVVPGPCPSPAQQSPGHPRLQTSLRWS